MNTRRTKLLIVSIAALIFVTLIGFFIFSQKKESSFDRRLKTSRLVMEEFRSEFSKPIAPWKIPPNISDQVGAEYTKVQTFYVGSIPQSHVADLLEFMRKTSKQHFPEGVVLRHSTMEIREDGSVAVFRTVKYGVSADSVKELGAEVFEEDISKVDPSAWENFYSLEAQKEAEGNEISLDFKR